MRFLIDENISPLVAEALRQQGYDVQHVREIGLKGRPDSEIMAYTRSERRCLVTLDEDFADLRFYPLGTHAGIIRLKLKFAPSSTVITCLTHLLPQLQADLLEKGSLIISEGTTYRIRVP